jgi:hypothetical protein
MAYFPNLFGSEPWFDYKVVSFILLGLLLFISYEFFNAPQSDKSPEKVASRQA